MITEATIKFKPCPFCGGDAKMHVRLNRPFFTVLCKNTKCFGHNIYMRFWEEEEAIEAWNRRAISYERRTDG